MEKLGRSVSFSPPHSDFYKNDWSNISTPLIFVMWTEFTLPFNEKMKFNFQVGVKQFRFCVEFECYQLLRVQR
jgi:hypothetical protein